VNEYPWQPPDRRWTTKDEIGFALGTHPMQFTAVHEAERPARVWRYLETMKHRARWGEVDPLAVRDACDGFLATASMHHMLTRWSDTHGTDKRRDTAIERPATDKEEG